MIMRWLCLSSVGIESYPMILVFGCRQSEMDHIYKEETIQAKNKEVFKELYTAYSREPGKPKVQALDCEWVSSVNLFGLLCGFEIKKKNSVEKFMNNNTKTAVIHSLQLIKSDSISIIVLFVLYWPQSLFCDLLYLLYWMLLQNWKWRGGGGAQYTISSSVSSVVSQILVHFFCQWSPDSASCIVFTLLGTDSSCLLCLSVRNMCRTYCVSSCQRRCTSAWGRREDTSTCVGMLQWPGMFLRLSSRSSSRRATWAWRMLASSSASFG